MTHFALAALLLFGLAGCAAPAPPLASVAGDAVDAGRDLLVTILPDAAPSAARFRAIAAEYGLELRAEWPIRTLGVDCAVFRAPDAAAVPALLARLAADRRVESVQRLHVFETATDRRDDPLRPLQGALAPLNLDLAHRAATGRGVRIALIDTGVAGDHEDLAGQVAPNRDFVAADPAPPPAERHGTALAGLIAARAGNGRGIAGVAPDATLLGLRGCWEVASGGRCSSSTLARALSFAIADGADIVNLSLRGPSDPLLTRLVAAAREAGIVVVAAYDPAAPGGFPADAPGVLWATPASGAPLGEAIAVPASRALTTVPGGYDFVSGSSVAAALVSGLVALLRQAAPGLDTAAAKAALHRAAGAGGVPDAGAALRAVGTRDGSAPRG